MKNSIHSRVHTLKDAWDLGRRTSHSVLMMTQRETEHTVHSCQVLLVLQYR
jgi:hypothetical protein